LDVLFCAQATVTAKQFVSFSLLSGLGCDLQDARLDLFISVQARSTAVVLFETRLDVSLVYGCA
jgi:hypothetical protein